MTRPADRIVINITKPAGPPPLHPCQVGRHRWAYLARGGQACGVCGKPR